MVNSRILKIGRNAASLLAGDVLHKASTFAVYALLSRHAGTHGFGQISYGLALLYLFNVFAAAGLQISVTREVAKQPTRAKSFLYNGYLAALIPSTLATLTMMLFAVVMNYERETLTVICILSLALYPLAMTMVSEAVIRGRERMHLVAISNVPGNVLMVAASAYVLLNDYGVVVLATVIALCRLLTFLVSNLVLHLSLRGEGIVGSVGISVAIDQLRKSMVFLGSDGINAIVHSLDAMILSSFATEAEIGLLQCSFQLLQPAFMVYRSIGLSSFPALVEAAKVGPEKIAEISRSLIGYMLRLSVPATVAMFVLAEDILVIVYGNEEFRAAGIVLKILCLTLILDLVKPIFGHGLWAMSREKSVLKIVIVNLIASSLTGLILISQFGLVGAACSVLIANFINLIQHNWYFQREVARMSLWREVVRLIPATALLLTCVAFLPTHRFLSLGLGLTAYVVVAFVIPIYVSTNFRAARRSKAIASN